MAYDGIWYGTFSNRPAYRIQLYVRRNAVSGNSSQYAWELRAQRTASGSTWSSTSYGWSVNIGGQGFGGSTAPDFRSTSDIFLGSGVTQWFAHDANGYLNINVAAEWNLNAELFGYAWAGGTFSTDRIAQVPPAPTPVATTPDQIGPTSMRYQFNGNGDGGSGILRWEIQYSTSASFSPATLITGGGTVTLTGLTPGTTYYIRARGVNAVGNGAWSAVKTGTTLSVAPPTISVAPAPTGLSATVTLVPPSTLPNPTGFVVERRVKGTTSPVVTYTPTTVPFVADNVSAGVTYEWRAAVLQGTFQSDWSEWVTAVQPAPNTNPGDYFDGSTAPKADQTYTWTGTANNSTSVAIAQRPRGWSFNAGSSGAVGVIARVTGGHSQAFGAGVTMFADATAPGFAAGYGDTVDRAAVGANGQYVGSIYVRIPGRSQRMAARIYWYTAAGALISSIDGEAQVVAQSTTEWTRLTVSGVAPANAVTAAVYAVDVAGTGWSIWLSGDTFVLDSAMIIIGNYPYFDGNTPDTAQFIYDWLGAENASASTRQAAIGVFVDPFADPDCDPIPLPPRAPVIDTDCIEEIGTWRRYWAIIAEQNIADWLVDMPALTVTTGPEAARQVRVRVYENPLGLAPADFDASVWVSEVIISYVPPNAVYVLNSADETMRGSVDGGVTWTNLNHLLYGTGATPPTWPILRCGQGYLISFDVPLDAPAGNLTTEISLTRRY